MRARVAVVRYGVPLEIRIDEQEAPAAGVKSDDFGSMA
jgi:hypothetical protein